MHHQNFMDITRMINAETALLCARLYLRDGKRHLQEGSFKEGIAALYDAILFAMHYYIAETTVLWQGSISFDLNLILAEVEAMLLKLGVIPFNESILQSESLAVC